MSSFNYDVPPVRTCPLCGVVLELRLGRLTQKFWFHHGSDGKGAWSCLNRAKRKPVFFPTQGEALDATELFQ